MKTKVYALIPVAALAMAMMMSGLAMAQPPDGPGGPDGKRQHRRAFVEEQIAKLPADKQATAKRLCAEFDSNTTTLRQNLASKHLELKSELTKPNPDETKVRALAKDLGDLKTEMYVAAAVFKNQLTKEGIPDLCGPQGCMDFDRGFGGPGRDKGPKR